MISGQIVTQTLGAIPVKAARDAAMKNWSKLTPKFSGDAVTLETAFESYLTENTLAPKYVENLRYNLERYLGKWKTRSLQDIGHDRIGVRALLQHLTKAHKKATANQVKRLLSAVYNYRRKVEPDLPENPTAVFETHRIAARNWAYSPEELKAWWHDVVEVDGKPVARGVSTLSSIKKMWWLTALFTGARKGSIEALRWNDLDFEKKVIRFETAKAGNTYAVPMSDLLAELLTQYRDSGDVPPSEWVFPSSVFDGKHIVGVKNDKEGVGPAHRLRHSYRTILAQLGASPDQARILLGHSMGGDVSRGYISVPLVIDSVRPVANAVAARYASIIEIDAVK